MSDGRGMTDRAGVSPSSPPRASRVHGRSRAFAAPTHDGTRGVAPSAGARLRVVIVTAEVGEGHAAAARALAADLLAARDYTDVAVCDALAGLGPLLRLILLDAYRWQLRFAPWLFGLLYAIFSRVPALRQGGAGGLAALGSRSLLRLVMSHRPDVVVSTYPAATSVLGRLRRRGEIDVPVLATITDLGGVAFWADRGIDLHLVMHEHCLDEVERVAGPGRAQAVEPLVAAAFRQPLSCDHARQLLGLPLAGAVIVVSGGGWGVGDLEGAVETALSIGDAHVVCVSGRNDARRRRLERRFSGERRPRILGFTEQMRELLAAADALVHTTGGVTCLEAWVAGCPTIAYGAPPGHAPLCARAFAAAGLVERARTRAELGLALGRALAGVARVAAVPTAHPTAASIVRAVAGDSRRVRERASRGSRTALVRRAIGETMLESAGAP
jgi:processive 1,2-diacylglycerol beta-glucosyltransferase